MKRSPKRRPLVDRMIMELRAERRGVPSFIDETDYVTAEKNEIPQAAKGAQYRRRHQRHLGEFRRVRVKVHHSWDVDRSPD
ncbi:hypothetical protein BN873_210198 [Candidatus Competibacter denitrificans Run_A_D11]|uniref:Uncharacterized protein n=1 Tax=Candidatus Competibacter denitrificans Run_A_D11 TaxID=1400863 RepID=W6M342_9GAMM|nr:hypothetical protein BN873_210198 [Candidatus Competibacter denitrificans Run_A_D11]